MSEKTGAKRVFEDQHLDGKFPKRLRSFGVQERMRDPHVLSLPEQVEPLYLSIKQKSSCLKSLPGHGDIQKEDLVGGLGRTNHGEQCSDSTFKKSAFTEEQQAHLKVYTVGYLRHFHLNKNIVGSFGQHCYREEQASDTSEQLGYRKEQANGSLGQLSYTGEKEGGSSRLPSFIEEQTGGTSGRPNYTEEQEVGPLGQPNYTEEQIGSTLGQSIYTEEQIDGTLGQPNYTEEHAGGTLGQPDYAHHTNYAFGQHGYMKELTDDDIRQSSHTEGRTEEKLGTGSQLCLREQQTGAGEQKRYHIRPTDEGKYDITKDGDTQNIRFKNRFSVLTTLDASTSGQAPLSMQIDYCQGIRAAKHNKSNASGYKSPQQKASMNYCKFSEGLQSPQRYGTLPVTTYKNLGQSFGAPMSSTNISSIGVNTDTGDTLTVGLHGNSTSGSVTSWNQQHFTQTATKRKCSESVQSGLLKKLKKSSSQSTSVKVDKNDTRVPNNMANFEKKSNVPSNLPNLDMVPPDQKYLQKESQQRLRKKLKAKKSSVLDAEKDNPG